MKTTARMTLVAGLIFCALVMIIGAQMFFNKMWVGPDYLIIALFLTQWCWAMLLAWPLGVKWIQIRNRALFYRIILLSWFVAYVATLISVLLGKPIAVLIALFVFFVAAIFETYKECRIKVSIEKDYIEFKEENV